MVPTGTPPTNPYPVCSVMDLSLKMQAEMVPLGTPSTNQRLVRSLENVSSTYPKLK